MGWFELGIYVMAGVVVCAAVFLIALARGWDALTDAFVVFGIAPELWILFLLWPVVLPIMIWMNWGAPPPPTGPTVIPAQVETNLCRREGVVIRELRPSGIVQIDGVEYEAVAQVGVIAVGETVVVEGQDSLRLGVVRRPSEGW